MRVQLRDVAWLAGLTSCALWAWVGSIPDATFPFYKVLILGLPIFMTIQALQNLGQNAWAFSLLPSLGVGGRSLQGSRDLRGGGCVRTALPRRTF